MRLEIPGNPIPLQRARTFKNVFYDPQHIVKKNYSEAALKCLTAAQQDVLPITKPIHLDLIFVFAIPKSWSKKKRELHLDKPHVARKDLDNLIKWIGDSLNKIFWEDDSLIWSMDAIKIWGLKGKTFLSIKEII